VKSNDLLDSWKEIAVFLNRGIRTAQRWEREEGLPVHRHGHNKRATVFALASEIQRWMSTRGVSYYAADGSLQHGVAYAKLTFEEIAARCIAARSRAQRVRRLVQLVYDQHQAEILRVLARLNGNGESARRPD